MDEEQLRLRQIFKYMMYGVLIVILFSLVYFWLSYGFVTVRVLNKDGIQGAPTIKSVSAQSEESEPLNIGDLYFVARNSKALRVTSENYTTLQTLKPLPYFGKASYTISVYKDKNATKIASDAPGCLSESATNEVASYDCNNPAYLLKFDPATWSNQQLASMASNTFALAPYQGGVIGILIGQETDVPVFVVDSRGNTSYIAKPESLSEDVVGSVNIATGSSAENPNFLLKSPIGTLYYGNREGEYTKFDAPKAYNPRFDAMFCSLVQTTIYCYYGPTSDSEDSEEATKHRSENPTGYLDIINTKTKERTTHELDGEGVDSLAVTEDGHVYGLTVDTLYSLMEPGQEPQRLFIDTGVDSISPGNALYFTKNNSLYRSENLQSYRVFTSENIRMSSVKVTGDSVLFNAYFENAPDDLDTLHTFRLTRQPNNGERRLIDMAPLDLGPSTVASDFNGDIIHVQVYTSVTSDRETGVTTIDQQEYEGNRLLALQALQGLGIDLKKYRIDFTY